MTFFDNFYAKNEKKYGEKKTISQEFIFANFSEIFLQEFNFANLGKNLAKINSRKIKFF